MNDTPFSHTAWTAAFEVLCEAMRSSGARLPCSDAAIARLIESALQVISPDTSEAAELAYALMLKFGIIADELEAREERAGLARIMS